MNVEQIVKIFFEGFVTVLNGIRKKKLNQFFLKIFFNRKDETAALFVDIVIVTFKGGFR